MLAIRMQRTGRKGHAMFRLIVQDSHRTPTSGNVVASLGNYDPHTKAIVLDKDKTSFYLEHGAQPSERTALLLRREGIKLPQWVIIHDDKKGKPRHEKRVKVPKETPAAVEQEAETTVEPSQEVADSEETTETVSDVVVDAPVQESADDVAEETEPTVQSSEETHDDADTSAEETPAEESIPEVAVETTTEETTTSEAATDDASSEQEQK